MRLIIILAMLMFTAQATAELEIRHSKFDYTWWDIAEFPVEGTFVGYTHWVGDVGFSYMYGDTNTRKNTVDGSYRALYGRIANMNIFGFHIRKKLKYVTLATGFSYSYYSEENSVKGGEIMANMDYGTGSSFSVMYWMSDLIGIKLSQDFYYNKSKVPYGEEITNATGISLVFNI